MKVYKDYPPPPEFTGVDTAAFKSCLVKFFLSKAFNALMGLATWPKIKLLLPGMALRLVTWMPEAPPPLELPPPPPQAANSNEVQVVERAEVTRRNDVVLDLTSPCATDVFFLFFINFSC